MLQTYYKTIIKYKMNFQKFKNLLKLKLSSEEISILILAKSTLKQLYINNQI
mgnify:CR=1 FL=1|jgi:hypothetical protein